MKAPSTPGGIAVDELCGLAGLALAAVVDAVGGVELDAGDGAALWDRAVAVGEGAVLAAGLLAVGDVDAGAMARGVGLPVGVGSLPLSCPLIPNAPITITAVQPAPIKLDQMLLVRPLMR